MVLMKKVVNANPGDADHVGGNDWDKLADYFNDTNVSEVPRINNPTEYRSGILKVRDNSNTYNVVIKSATQTAHRDWTIPALTGNDSPATLGLPNVFTAVQQVQLDADTLLNLYRPTNTTNSLNSIGFFHRNSSNASVNYASISSQVITNTNALEDGKLKFFVKKAGVLTEVMSIDKNGLLTVTNISSGGGVQTINVNDPLPLIILRPANTANNLAGIDFEQYNSSSAAKTYARYQSKIITNTASSEVGAIEEYVMRAGTVTKVRSMDQNGVITLGPNQNQVVSSFLLCSGSATTVSNTVTETDLLNYTVKGNTMGANGCLRVRISGYILQNDSTSRAYQVKVKFGGTTILDSITQSMAQAAANRPFYMEFTLGNLNSTSSQTGTGKFSCSLADVTATTGIGDINDDEIQVDSIFGFGTSSANTTSDQVLAITMTHATASTSVQTVVQRKLIEFIPGVPTA